MSEGLKAVTTCRCGCHRALIDDGCCEFCWDYDGWSQPAHPTNAAKGSELHVSASVEEDEAEGLPEPEAQGEGVMTHEPDGTVAP